MNQKENLKLINYFLKTQEPGYMPNFLFSKKRNTNKKRVHNNSKTLNNNTIQKSRNDAIDTINSFSNTQSDKSKYLTPFQKLLKYKEDIKTFNTNKIKHLLSDNPIELMPTIKSDRKSKSKSIIHIKNQINTSPKEYINKIKLYKIKSNGYNTIKNDLYNFDINLNKIKINNINSEVYYTTENKPKINTLKKSSIENNKLNEKNNKNDNSKNDLNLHINKELLLQLKKDFNINLNLYKVKKKIKNNFFNDNYEQLIHNIETDSVNSPKIYIKKENKKKKVNNYSDDIKYLLRFSRFKRNNKNKNYIFLNDNIHSSQNINLSNNKIRDIKKVSNISSLFFSPEYINNSKTHSRNNTNYKLNKENNTNYY